METLMLRASPKMPSLVHQCWHFLSYWAAEFMVASETNICYVFAFSDHLPSDNDSPFITKTASPSSPSSLVICLRSTVWSLNATVLHLPPGDFQNEDDWGTNIFILKIWDLHFEYYWGWLIFPFPNINPRLLLLVDISSRRELSQKAYTNQA